MTIADVTARADSLADRLAVACAAVEAIEPDDAFDPAAPAAIVASGLHLAAVPAAFGGGGAGLSDAVRIMTALGAIDGSTALGFAMHLHVTGAAAQSTVWPSALRERLFRAVVDDGALVNAASTEEGGGSPARGAIPGTLATQATPSGPWLLNGEKTWTTWLPALRYALVSARVDRPTDPAQSPEVANFLVDLESPGIERLTGFEAMGMRGSASGRLRLTDVEVPADALLLRRGVTERDPRGPVPGAWFAICIASAYLGVGEGAREAVAQWALDRRPGDGSTAVADLQTIQLRLGRMDAALRTARIVVEDVARRWDAAPDDAGRSALESDLTLAKLTATNAAALATEEALRIAGGPGFLSGRLERAFRDARAGLINPPLDDVALTGFGRAVVARHR